MKKIFLSVALFFASVALGKDLDIKKVVLWGHKLHSHTHSYIHEAFYRAFKHLGYDVHWFDDNDNVRNFDFSNCLFITEGQVDKRIPVNDSSFYILYNCFQYDKYKALKQAGRVIHLQVYLDKYRECFPDNREVEPCIIISPAQQMIFMPWATNLLPEEIEHQKERVKKHWGNFKKRS